MDTGPGRPDELARARDAWGTALLLALGLALGLCLGHSATVRAILGHTHGTLRPTATLSTRPAHLGGRSSAPHRSNATHLMRIQLP